MSDETIVEQDNDSKTWYILRQGSFRSTSGEISGNLEVGFNNDKNRMGLRSGFNKCLDDR